MQAAVIIIVFVLTYVGMAAGRLPWLQVDRTGIALLAVIALLATEAQTLDDIGTSIVMPPLVLLFALMIISAQFVEAGFYDRCARWVTEAAGSPALLLALTVGVVGGLSALLANDILIFALVPPLIVGVQARGLDPRPFVIAIAAATNAGSAATFIGNPQNIVIGELGDLGFGTFLVACGVPAIVSLLFVFAVIWLIWHRRMTLVEPAMQHEIPPIPVHPLDRNQTIKGLIAMVALLALFTTSLAREIGALIIAALLMTTRKFTSRTMIAAVDWPLLLLLACLFAVTGAVADTGLPWKLISELQDWGLLPDSLVILTPLTLLASNTIGNVPAVILLMQSWQNPPKGMLYSLALLTSLAGNLTLVGSLSNLMVVERAATFGVRIDFAEHARVGIPVTILSVLFAVFWLAYMGWLPLLPETPPQ